MAINESDLLTFSGVGEDELRRLLTPFGLGDLAPIAYQLYLRGITDIDELMLALEGTEAFRQRFPGIRDPETNELVMGVREYVEYERNVLNTLAAFGIDPEDLGASRRAFVGQMVQSRRAITEVRADLEAYNELRNSPFVRQQFYAYTGIDPGDVGLFALALGVAPQLEQAYQQAVDEGVSLQEFEQRLTGGTPTGDAAAISAEIQGAIANIHNVEAFRSIAKRFEDFEGTLAEIRQGPLAEGFQFNEQVLERFEAIAERFRERVQAFEDLQANDPVTLPEDLQVELDEAQQDNLFGQVSEMFANPIFEALQPEGAFPFLGFAGVPRNQRLRALRQALLAQRAQFQSGGEFRFEAQPPQRTF